MKALTATAPGRLRPLVEVLPALALTDGERAEARIPILQALTAAEETWQVRVLAKDVVLLAPTGAERAQTRRTVLQARATVDDP
ncbi:hypothetical protein [Arthrobacter sp. ISL-65]|uniref:hypothetical protein n=1 Tax=Arthrobacter sp. ISL-65 TaxID=2819112 RepID=UPI001BEAF628|nr:hypothetical protein [Arthrobacter sp. ISL-65]MBT2548934.1 hypothetical protein [Arthrobacter sp. ISL-65]